MAATKESIIHLLRVLINYSDEEHPIGMSEIIDRINNEFVHEQNVTRQAIYNNINMINALCDTNKIDFHINSVNKNGTKYYLSKKPFEQGELRFLMDCVYSNTAIPANYSAQLVRKLQCFTSERYKEHYKGLVLDRKSMKTTNKEVFYNIEIIDKAIADEKMVSFTYTMYGSDKKLHPKGKPHILSPYGMTSYDNSYYLIGKYPQNDVLRHFHVSRIKNISITDEKAEAIPYGFHLDEYMQKAVFMYSDAPATITLRCKNRILDALITRFGTDVRISDYTDEEFTATFTASLTGTRIWALQMIDCVEVVEPESLRSEIIDIIKNSAYFE